MRYKAQVDNQISIIFQIDLESPGISKMFQSRNKLDFAKRNLRIFDTLQYLTHFIEFNGKNSFVNFLLKKHLILRSDHITARRLPMGFNFQYSKSLLYEIKVKLARVDTGVDL